ncbi:MAG TPA: hypothetical protein VJ111_10940 [Chitinophagaceae bacterium]|nr:hypothetical protein [Chitinophagaceae bacterium]
MSKKADSLYRAKNYKDAATACLLAADSTPAFVWGVNRYSKIY